MISKMSSGSGGSGSMTYATVVGTFVGTETFNNISNAAIVVTYGTDGQLLGYIIVENGTLATYKTYHGSFSASYSSGTLSITWNYGSGANYDALYN